MAKDRTPWWQHRWIRVTESIFVAVAAFLLVTILVVRYEHLIHKVNWSLVSIVFSLIAMAFGMVYWAGRTDNRYIVLDLLTNPEGRADFEKHIIWVLLLLTVWVIVQKVFDKEDVDNLLLGSLAVFILKRVADKATDAYKSKPSAPAEGGGSLQINAPNADTVNVPGATPGRLTKPLIVPPKKG